MNKKNLLLLLTCVALLGLAVYLMRDSFEEEPIQIAYSVRPAPEGRQTLANRRDTPSGKRGFILSFALDQKTPLTSVKVFVLEDAQTNKYPHAIWHLTSDSNSVPVKSFDYGVGIRGMRPHVKGAQATPLEPGKSYRLLVQTPEQTAQRDFQMPP